MSGWTANSDHLETSPSQQETRVEKFSCCIFFRKTRLSIPNFQNCRCSVLTWRHSAVAIELAVECGEIIEPAFKGDRGNRNFCVAQAMLSMLDCQPTQVPKPGITCNLSEQFGKSPTWNIELVSRRIDRCLFEKAIGKRIDILLNKPPILCRSFRYPLRLS